MRRTLEKLSSQSQKKQEEFSRILEDIQKNTRAIKDRIGELKAGLSPARLKDGKKGLFPTGRSRSKNASFPESFPTQLLSILTEHQNITERVTELITSSVDLMEAKDREWDALGNHHVGMIFKSMEWRVDKLAALYGDVSLLMKTFLRLRGQLDRLLTSLEERQEPSRDKVEEVLHPLEDWRYAGFENRFRGSEEDVKTQQASFLAYFEKGGKVLDLGCGRGEFLELLEEKGIDALGVDINRQMVEICRDKGLECQEGDLLEVLMEQEDRSLGGIFSSQVIEHLPPDYLQKLIEVCYFKLAPGRYLVLETLNPACVFALVQIYLLDLSHQKPIHPRTLTFLLEATGFEQVKIQYSAPLEKEQLRPLPGADEVTSIMNQNIDTLNSLLYAPPNYAAVGMKGPP